MTSMDSLFFLSFLFRFHSLSMCLRLWILCIHAFTVFLSVQPKTFLFWGIPSSDAA